MPSRHAGISEGLPPPSATVEGSRTKTPYAALGVEATISEALGTSHRPDPVLPRTGGPAGNARLTAWLGLILLVLLAIEGVTILDIHGLITWHIVVGALLVPPALLKTATTGWRMARYYSGNAPYKEAGPPPLPLRLLGPLVVLSTLAVLATGILVGVLGPASARGQLWGTPLSPLFFHQASFAVWFVVMTLHVLGRFIPALRIVSGRAVAVARVDGRLPRVLVLVLGVAVAVVTAKLILDGSATWQHDTFFGHGGGDH